MVGLCWIGWSWLVLECFKLFLESTVLFKGTPFILLKAAASRISAFAGAVPAQTAWLVTPTRLTLGGQVGLLRQIWQGLL